MVWCGTCEPSLQLYMSTELPTQNTPKDTPRFISVISQAVLPNQRSEDKWLEQDNEQANEHPITQDQNSVG